MPLTLSIADDFDLYDGVQLVTFARRPLDGSTPVTYSSVKALKRSATSMAKGTGGTMVTVARWHLKAADLPLPPRVGDTFTTVSAETWEILPDVDACAFSTRYACSCKKVAG